MNDKTLEVGQVWHYDHRPHEAASQVVICHLEEDERLGSIAHVVIEGVNLGPNRRTGRPVETIGHMPFAAQAVRESITVLAGRREELPNFLEGYNLWKEAFGNGNAGIFTIAIKDAVGVVESMLSNA